MNKRQSLIAALSAIGLTLAVSAANYIPSQGIYINGSTNAVPVAGGNSNACVVSAVTTNRFNLSNALNDSSNTNLWPSQPVAQFGIQSRYVTVGWSLKADASTSGSIPVRLAGSMDGTMWVTNQFFFGITTAGTAVQTGTTNLDIGSIPFLSIQTIENTNATANVTNLALWFVQKPYN